MSDVDTQPLHEGASAWLKNSLKFHLRERQFLEARCTAAKYAGDLKRAADMLADAHGQAAKAYRDALRSRLRADEQTARGDVKDGTGGGDGT